VSQSKETSNEISFKKDYPLTFAFSCKEIQIVKKKIVAGEWIVNARGIGPDMIKQNLLDDDMDQGALLIDISSDNV